MTTKEATAIQAAVKEFGELAEQFGTIDIPGSSGGLAQPEVDALAFEAVSIKEALKKVKEVADERIESIRSIFFKAADTEVGAAKPFTYYSPEHGMKLERQVAQIGGGISQEALLAGLYQHFGEEVGDTSGRAWAVWSKVTDPVQTRVINEGKLEAELAKAIEHQTEGKKHGSTALYMPVEVVQGARIEPTLQERFYAKRMSKDDMKEHGA